MSGPAVSFALDTLAWTAVLIVIVLILRRPVGRWLGPQAAYALWALPLLRLFLPPVVLPAWMRPVEQATPIAATELAAAPVAGPVGDAVVATVGMLPAGAVMSQTTRTVDWPALALAVWLGGAAIFVALRFNSYFTMRKKLLADARDVGEAGAIRLVETPRTTAPVAFGVLDKVVALPMGFMAHFDRTSRDLALEHELAHHHGRDLAVNMIAQPLFALHWFNPLGWAGWRAMRRDQEAACDARVVAQRDRSVRAMYAEVIASFATGPRVALAAPMACPVLGDKSIIHRLRSLKMSEVSQKRRHAGRALLVVGALALPLTASISYAEVATSDLPAPPAPPSAAMAIAPTVAVPLAPPVAPPAPAPVIVQAAAEAEAPEVSPETRVVVVNTSEEGEDGYKKRVIERSVHNVGEPLSDEERREIMIEVEEAMAEAREGVTEARAEMHMAIAEIHDDGKSGHTTVKVECDGKKEVSEKTDRSGHTVVMICESQILANALDGLKKARKELERNSELDGELRKQVLQSLDRQIADWESHSS